MIHFDVTATPASSKSLAIERATNALSIKRYRLAALPTLLLSVLGGILIAKGLYPHSSDPDHLHASITAATTAVGAAVAVIWLYFHFFRRLVDVEADLADLSADASEYALMLADAEPQIEAYRLAVVKRRSMVMGDLRAMDAYAIQAADARILQQERMDERAHRAALYDGKSRTVPTATATDPDAT